MIIVKTQVSCAQVIRTIFFDNQCIVITPAVSITFNVISAWAAASFSLRLFKNVLFSGNILHHSIVTNALVTNGGIDR